MKTKLRNQANAILIFVNFVVHIILSYIDYLNKLFSYCIRCISGYDYLNGDCIQVFTIIF